jgi:hypothetical protein
MILEGSARAMFAVNRRGIERVAGRGFVRLHG